MWRAVGTHTQIIHTLHQFTLWPRLLFWCRSLNSESLDLEQEVDPLNVDRYSCTLLVKHTHTHAALGHWRAAEIYPQVWSWVWSCQTAPLSSVCPSLCPFSCGCTGTIGTEMSLMRKESHSTRLLDLEDSQGEFRRKTLNVSRKTSHVALDIKLSSGCLFAAGWWWQVCVWTISWMKCVDVMLLPGGRRESVHVWLLTQKRDRVSKC